MLYAFIDYLKEKGHELTHEAVMEYYRYEFGDLPEEWTQEQKRAVKKEISKVIQKMDVPYRPNLDEIVEYLWASGWEFRSGPIGVYGLETFVKNWYARMFPKEDIELVKEEANDPRLLEALVILKEFYVEPTPRECRMILRNETPTQWIRYACELFRAHGKPQSHYSIRNILQEADFRFKNKDNRNCDSI